VKKIIAELLALLWKFARKVLWKWLLARLAKLGVYALVFGIAATIIALLVFRSC